MLVEAVAGEGVDAPLGCRPRAAPPEGSVRQGGSRSETIVKPSIVDGVSSSSRTCVAVAADREVALADRHAVVDPGRSMPLVRMPGPLPNSVVTPARAVGNVAVAAGVVVGGLAGLQTPPGVVGESPIADATGQRVVAGVEGVRGAVDRAKDLVGRGQRAELVLRLDVEVVDDEAEVVVSGEALACRMMPAFQAVADAGPMPGDVTVTDGSHWLPASA